MTAPRTAAASAALAERHISVANVLVPMSLSATSEAALAPAAQLKRHFRARLHLVAVGIERAEAESMERRLTALATGLGAAVHTRVDWDVPAGILAIARDYPSAVICMASHARGRLGEAVLGSYTTLVLAKTADPLVLVGPDYDPERSVTAGPVLACVDGSAVSEQVVPVAAGWAAALGVGLRIVTVAEPAPSGLDDRAVRRSRGPTGDPQAYVDRLAEGARRPDLAVEGVTVYDPISVMDGLDGLLEGSPGGLLAVTTHARTGIRRAVFGSQAASILRHSPVPVLVVPPLPS